jgi:mono/diheme cytochrome c family protein
MIARSLIVLFLAAAGLLTGCRCSSTGSDPAGSSPASSSTAADPKAELIKRGKTVYAGNCMACHNMDPKLAGSLGPDVFGSSRELIEARLVKGTYPEGYKPKRPGAGMPLFPHLAGEIDALHAFLNAE